MRDAKIYLLEKKNFSNFYAAALVRASEYGLNNFVKKNSFFLLFIKDISFISANILKQDALSIGAELLCDKETITAGKKLTNALLIISEKQRKILSEKLLLQPFSLKKLANFLKLLNTGKKQPKIMAILNINNDSFYQKSRTSESEFLEKITKLVDSGVEIVDIGAISSAPNAKNFGEEIELKRLAPIFRLIKEHKLQEKIDFSIDTIYEKSAKIALECGFSFINDISANKKLARLAKEYEKTYILMHSSNNYVSNFIANKPYQKTNDCEKKLEILDEVASFFAEFLAEFDGKIVLDAGIGFGKTRTQNQALIKHFCHFESLQKPLLLALSNKGCVDKNQFISLFYEGQINADFIRTHEAITLKKILQYTKEMEQI